MAIDVVCRERPAALSGEYKGRIAQGPAPERKGHWLRRWQARARTTALSFFAAACAAALATSKPPRKVSKQLVMIVPKIKEVDAVLRADRTTIEGLYEVHPGLAFWRLNAERALDQPKKVKGACYVPGLTLRRELLIKADIPTSIVEAAHPKGAGIDDMLDALACAAVARRIYAGHAQPFPDPPGRDAFGLPVAIWA